MSYRSIPRSLSLRLAALTVLSAAIALPSTQAAQASTDSTWGAQPSWASNPSSDSSRARTSVSRDSTGTHYRYSKASPFSPGSNNIALEMGQVFLMGNLGANYSDSIGLRLNYTYGVSDLFAFNSSIGYSNHSDGRFSMASLMAGLRTNLAWYDKVVPYFSFGLGFFKPTYSGGPSLTGDSSSGPSLAAGTTISPMLFGVHLGPGVDLELTQELFFGASITFHDVFGKTELTSDGKAFDVGGTFASFFLHAGVTF